MYYIRVSSWILVIVVDREVAHSIVPTHPLENGMFIYLLDGIF